MAVNDARRPTSKEIVILAGCIGMFFFVVGQAHFREMRAIESQPVRLAQVVRQQDRRQALDDAAAERKRLNGELDAANNAMYAETRRRTTQHPDAGDALREVTVMLHGLAAELNDMVIQQPTVNVVTAGRPSYAEPGEVYQEPVETPERAPADTLKDPKLFKMTDVD